MGNLEKGTFNIGWKDFQLAVEAGGRRFPTQEGFVGYVGELRATLQTITDGGHPPVEAVEQATEFFSRYGALQFERAQLIAQSSPV